MVTVKANVSAIDGFKKMWTLGVPAVAVVNEVSKAFRRTSSFSFLS